LKRKLLVFFSNSRRNKAFTRSKYHSLRFKALEYFHRFKKYS